MNQPLVTVLIPMYNAEDFVEQSVRSILEQTYTNFELLIIDDGSTDRSVPVVESFSDQRIKLVRNEKNLKLIATLNKGLSLAKGKYIVRLDADDIAIKERIETQVSFMEEHPEVGLCGTWYEAFGDVSSVVRYPTDHQSLKYMSLYQCPIIHPSTIFRTSVIKEHGLKYDLDYPHAEDYKLWGQFAMVSQLANVPEVLLRYRLHDSNISKQQASTQKSNSIRIRTELFHELGLNVSPNQLEAFMQMNHQVDNLTLEQLKSLGTLLSNMIVSNNNSSYLNSEWLSRTLNNKWYETCSNHAHLGWSVFKTYLSYENLLSEKPRLEKTSKIFVKSIRGELQ
ncbi:MAG: glycosyltransferase [Flavobacteriales bacterium]|nr:glycosyltransferase [Flavobacteriales bacterium]